MNEKETPQIRDIPKFKEMRQTMQGFKIINAIFPFANPFLKLLGVETEKMKEALSKFPELQKEFEELSEMPDKFNDIFVSRGFIIFKCLNPEIVVESLRIAETNIDEAENFLISHFTPEIVETYLYMMQGVRAFRPRMELAEKALVDYKEERYHACIPVVLMLTDGLVNEINPNNVGIAAEKVDLRAWNCITSHEKGLNALKEVIFRGRTKTTTEEITIPYRHGILHGMDLGYANKTVAAKTWALLFAVCDWAIKAEGKNLGEPPPKPQTTWKELLLQISEHSNWKKSFDLQLEEWKPRELVIGKDLPSTGEIDDFQNDAPERKLVEFLVYWQKKNYGNMAKCVWSYLNQSDKKMAGRVRKNYSQYLLESFELLEIIDEAPAITEIKVSLKYKHNKNEINNLVKFRLIINDGQDGKPLMRNMPNATWGIVNWGYGIIFNQQNE